MRIAHVSATFPPYWGGTGNVCYHNALELSKRGHEVHVFTASAENAVADELIEGIHIHRLHPIIRIGNAPLIPGLLQLNGFDVIHLHFPFFGGELAALAARLRHIPLVITYHQDVQLSGILGVIERILRTTISRWVLRSADKILFTSKDYSEVSYSLKLLRGREDRIGELPNGVDPVHFKPGAPDDFMAMKYKPTGKEQLILLVAGLDKAHYFKGIPILLEALSQQPEQVKAVIVGDGDLKSEYEKISNNLGIEDRVFFPGRVSNKLLPQYYQIADVTVLPSTTMGEAFGLVLVESLACGTPVIASNLPGVRTVVSDGVDGFLVNPNDIPDLSEKIKKLLSLSEETRHIMGVSGREKVSSQYTWEFACDKLETIYDEVIKTHSSKSNWREG